MAEFKFASPWLSILILLIAVPAPPANAEEVRIVLANDFLTANNADDLYTGALALGFDLGRYCLHFGENIFTDRENEIRFDETYLAVERGLPDLGGWHASVELGVIHVGKGLLGQGTQNSLHRLIGDDEVDFPYVENDRLHPTLGLCFHRPLPDLGNNLKLSWTYNEFGTGSQHFTFDYDLKWRRTWRHESRSGA